ncbi:MAG: DUF5107 domain-containing protein [Chloroflexota bacterium]
MGAINRSVIRLARLASLFLVAFAFSLIYLLARPTPHAAADSPGVAVYTDTVAIPTYTCTTSTQYNATYNLNYPKYEPPCADHSVGRAYTRLNLENSYVRLSLLPELGGRVYEFVFKPTGHNEFYQNPVIKPTPWGRPEQGYRWLAAGGLEWGLPLEEHGYEWGIPWTYTVISATAGVTVSLRDSAPAADRLRALVSVHLPPDRALFQVTHRLENGRSAPLNFSYWTNAMLAPGAPNAPTGQLRFIFPAAQVQVHSRDPNDNFLPPDGGVLDWPGGPGRDMSRLGEWSGWFGFFAYPRSQDNFTGVYDPSLQEGVMHVFPKNVVLGSKGFGFGWTRAIDWHLWTDDGSAYVELHNGPQPTFWHTTYLDPGASLTYTDMWYPLSGLGTSLKTETQFAATEHAALALTPTPAGFELGLFTPAAQPNVRAVLRRLDNGAALDERIFAALDPTTPQHWPVSAPGLGVADVSLLVFAGDGSTLVGINANTVPPSPPTWLPLVLKIN